MKFLIGFRKFTLAATFFIVSLILLLTGIVNSSEWIKYNSEVAIAFFGTNIGEHLIQLGKAYFQDKVVDRVLTKKE
jgi:hypothetical protein